MQAPCDLITVDRFLMKRDFALAISKHSYLLPDLNKGLSILKQQGTLRGLYKKWWYDKNLCSGIKSSSVVSKYYTNTASSVVYNQKYCGVWVGCWRMMVTFSFFVMMYFSGSHCTLYHFT